MSPNLGLKTSCTYSSPEKNQNFEYQAIQPGLIKAKPSLKSVMATGIRLAPARIFLHPRLHLNTPKVHKIRSSPWEKKTWSCFFLVVLDSLWKKRWSHSFASVECCYSFKPSQFFQVSSENHLNQQLPHLKQSSGNCKACGPSLGNISAPMIILPKWWFIIFPT